MLSAYQPLCESPAGDTILSRHGCSNALERPHLKTPANPWCLPQARREQHNAVGDLGEMEMNKTVAPADSEIEYAELGQSLTANGSPSRGALHFRLLNAPDPASTFSTLSVHCGHGRMTALGPQSGRRRRSPLSVGHIRRATLLPEPLNEMDQPIEPRFAAQCRGAIRSIGARSRGLPPAGLGRRLPGSVACG